MRAILLKVVVDKQYIYLGIPNPNNKLRRQHYQIWEFTSYSDHGNGKRHVDVIITKWEGLPS